MTYDASVQKDGDDSTTSGGSRPFWGRIVNWRPYQGLVAIVTVSPPQTVLHPCCISRPMATDPASWSNAPNAARVPA